MPVAMHSFADWIHDPIASCTFRSASSGVAPSDIQPGSSGTTAKYPPPSLSGSRSMRTVYSSFASAVVMKGSGAVQVSVTGCLLPRLLPSIGPEFATAPRPALRHGRAGSTQRHQRDLGRHAEAERHDAAAEAAGDNDVAVL